jgi:dipeptidyl aminopeptidase/acylaminoacyl peptidase
MPEKSVHLEVDGLTIDGRLYLPGSGAAYPAICVCHGIPSGMPDANDGGYPLLAENLSKHGFAVFIFNFRGCGESGGNLDIPGWTRDLGAAIDYLVGSPEVDSNRLALLGFSAGAAVSVYVAARDKRIAAVATCACPAEFSLFTEIADPQQLVDHFRNIGAIRDQDFPDSNAAWLNGFRLINPIESVDKIAPRPLLLVQGNDDEVVNVAEAHRLYQKAGEPRQVVIIEGAGHRLRQDENAMAAVTGWLKTHLLP